MSALKTVFSAAALVMLAFGCAAPAEEEDDTGATEGAASAVDPRTRDYTFELETAKLPACTTAGCSMQIRVKTQGRFWRTVSESCIQFDMSGRKAIRNATDYAKLQTDSGALAGLVNTVNLAQGAKAALLGDIYGVELSVEEGTFAGPESIDLGKCAAGTNVLHKVRVKFDEKKDASKTSTWTKLSFASHLKYVFEEDKLTFAPSTCYAGIDTSSPFRLACNVSADGGTSTDAGVADSGNDADAATDAGQDASTTAPTQHTTTTSSSSEEHEQPAASDDDSDPAPDATEEETTPKKKSDAGGCNVGPTSSTNLGAFGIALGLALLANRRRRA